MMRVTRLRALASAIVLTALAFAPASARAQSIPDSAFDAATTTELRRILADSRNAGLPEAPLLNRIRQGAARHVGGQRVVALVRAHADSMRAARVALGPRASSDELDAGASALLAGASRTALHRLRAVRAEGSATTAIIVLTDLLWRGVSSNDAANAIAELAERSNDKALLALQGAVARDATPASPKRLQSLVERFAVPTGDQPPGARTPTRRPVPPDTLVPLESRSTPEEQDALEPRASLALSSLSAPAGASPRAVLAEGEWNVPLWRVWSVAPTSALRLDEDGTRWSAGLAIARQLQLPRSLGARLWLSGEVRSPIAQARTELPLNPDLGARAIPSGRARDLVLQAGTDLQRTVGPWIVTGRFALGRARYSSLETILVPREVPIVPDTQTPRPDTLQQHTVLEPSNVWRILGVSTARGGLALQRGAYRLEGTVVQRLAAGRRSGDSLASVQRTLLIVGGERQLSTRLAVVAQWSSHDPSLVTGSLALHDARWRLGLRMAAPSRYIVPPSPPRTPRDAETLRGPFVELQVDSGAVKPGERGARVVRIRVRLPGARTVQVEGDLTGWTATALAPEKDGSFSGTFVSAGPIVRLRIRADGGAWVTPPGVPTQRDDFGDLVAVYVLSG